MQARISLSSTSYADLKHLLCFLHKNPLLQENIAEIANQKTNKRTFTWTLLRSPHVNKIAREQLSRKKHHLILSTKFENLSSFTLFYKKVLSSISSRVSTRLTFYSTGKLNAGSFDCNIETKDCHYFSLIKSDVQGESLFYSSERI